MAISQKLLDQLIADCKKPEDLIGENGILKQLTKALLERAMQAEITDHLGYPRNAPAGKNSGNFRNDSDKKKLKGNFGEIDVAVPRDRNGSFEPIIVPTVPGIDEYFETLDDADQKLEISPESVPHHARRRAAGILITKTIYTKFLGLS